MIRGGFKYIIGRIAKMRRREKKISGFDDRIPPGSGYHTGFRDGVWIQ